MDLLLDAFLNHLLVERGLSLNTLEAYRRDLHKYLDFLRAQGIKDITATSDVNIILFLATVTKAHLSHRTVARNLSSIKMFYKYLADNNHIKTNPAAILESPRGAVKLPQVLSMEEFDLLLQRPDRKNPRGLRDAALLELLYATGLRGHGAGEPAP